jgi:putative ABC transport system substrate-binding protein
MGSVQAGARDLGLEVAAHGIRQAEDIAPAFDDLKGKADALYVVEHTLLGSNGARIAALALTIQLPTTFTSSASVRAGGLMSYGPNFPALFRRAADFVDKILRGAKPSDLPVEQPTQFDLVINLKTATALGLTVRDKLLALANEVIE